MPTSQAGSRRQSSRYRRCPACGHKFRPPGPSHCALCGLALANPPTTGADMTPYAQAYADGRRGFGQMMRWVFFAGPGRMRHLALMQASPASRRFARVNIVLLAFCATAYHLTFIGWHEAKADVSAQRGDGWVAVASAPHAGGALAGDTLPVVLWWSARQAGVFGTISLVTSLLGIWGLLALLRYGIERAHHAPYRGELRMSAALHYGTTWFVPLSLALLIGALMPVSRAGTLAGWSWAIPQIAVLIPAGGVAALGLLLGWFWLLRLATMAPVRSRGRLVLLLGVVAPVFLLGAAIGWHLGLLRLYAELIDRFHWGFTA